MFAQSLGAEETTQVITMPSPTVPLYSPNPWGVFQNPYMVAAIAIAAYVGYLYLYDKE